jgi:cytochrome c553
MQVRMPVRWVAVVMVGVLAGFAGFASAAPGNAQAGAAQAPVCAACHGQDGATPLDPTYPNIAGQSERYLRDQLLLIQSNARPVPMMTPLLVGKTEQDLADLAAYYASLPAKPGQAEGDDASVALAQGIYRGGNLNKGVAACVACHGPSGKGNPPAGFPAIAGQSKAYTIKQLTDYREGRRVSDEAYGGMMRGVAAKLNDTEVAALADYLHGLR